MLLQVLIALTAVIVIGQLLSRLLARFGQPPVIGEVLAGILLGPSILGTAWSAAVLPPTVAPYLGVIAQLGVILYMFLVGLELQFGELRRQARATIAISSASIILPFSLGSLLSIWLYPYLAPAGVPFLSFMLFLGVAMSITAFPVLARILTDRGLTRTELGVIALSAAAVDDVSAWCLLAFVSGVARAEVGGAVVVAVGAVVFIAVMFFAVKPLIARLVQTPSAVAATNGATAAMFVALLLAAIVAEGIGIHAIFGAFLLGALVPSESRLATTMTGQLRPVVTILLLPAFFAFTGMRTRIDLVNGIAMWAICGLIIVVAVAGKFGGATLAARLSGVRWRQAAAVGALMNTRGLMELIVLNVGLELGVISSELFSMMVIMALVTTMMAAPALTIFRASDRGSA